MDRVHLELAEKSYDIFIGSGIIFKSELFTKHIEGKSVFVISNKSVATHYLDALLSSLEGFNCGVYLMPEGEQFKNLETVEDIIGSLLESGANRSTSILALGGGVVGDTAGFVASVFQRGVPFLQVPTTLLSQVDSSVGGKTAVNHSSGKNMIGAFYQPKTVVIDIETLATLPAREIKAGLSEIIKHGVLANRDYFETIERDLEKLVALDKEKLQSAIAGSCSIKAEIVSRDELESGQRVLLNFGHTFGHAIETATGYDQWLHGEAVGAGMIMAADLSMRMGKCNAEEAMRIKHIVMKAGLPFEPPEFMDEKMFLELMRRDKKSGDNGVRLVLLNGGIGKTSLVENVPQDLLRQTLEARGNLCKGS